MHKPAPQEAVTSLHDLSAVDLIAGFRAKQFSPSEVLEDVLTHIAVWEPHIKALFAFDPDGARATAKASTDRWQGGEPIGPLDGVPVTIKDNIATKGTPVPLGAATTKLVPAAVEAPPAARLREAGAVIFSKTTMPDYGMLSSGLSSFHPLTRNPWDLGKNPGGSSSGAGAPGAAGYGPLHLGTDTGGSVRLPACWCGLVALKPSLGRIPIDPPYVGRVAGPMTRTVDDAALMMSVLSKPDRRDGMSLPPNDINWKLLDLPPRKLRIGLMLDLGIGQALQKEVRDVAVKAAKAFESAGAVITEVDGVLTREMLDGLDNFWRARMWDDLSKLAPAERGKALPYILKWAEAGAKLSGVDVVRGFNATMAIRAAAAKLFGDLDYVISPVSPVLNFGAELAAPINDPDKPFEHICYTVPWNMSEKPAASINGAFSASGFPIGVQIVGRRFDDLGVLGMAKAFEGLRGPQKPWPRPPTKGRLLSFRDECNKKNREETPMAYETIKYEVAEQILTITLNRPDKLNAFNGTMQRELIDAFDAADKDDNVRAIIVTGAGRGFCAGADLSEGAKTFDRDARRGPVKGLADGKVDYSDPQVRDGGGMVTLRIFKCLKPVIAAVNGPAVGIGVTMQLAMDIRIASENARFGFVFSQRGIVPEAASSWFLPRIVGISQALEWCYTGRVFPAQEALAGRLVSKVVPPDELLPAARALAREIAAKTAPVSVALIRQMMWRMLGADDPMEAHKVDSRGIYTRGRSEDVKEGVVSFLEKRPAVFKNKVSADMPDYFPWWDEREYK